MALPDPRARRQVCDQFAEDLFPGYRTKRAGIKAIVTVVAHQEILPGAQPDRRGIAVLALSWCVGGPVAVLHHDCGSHMVHRGHPGEALSVQRLGREWLPIDDDAILSYLDRARPVALAPA